MISQWRAADVCERKLWERANVVLPCKIRVVSTKKQSEMGYEKVSYKKECSERIKHVSSEFFSELSAAMHFRISEGVI